MNIELPEVTVARELARERLTNQVLDATSLEEIAAARMALKEWIGLHPAEEGMSDAFEQLSLLEDVALAEIAEAKYSVSPFDQKRHDTQIEIDSGARRTSGHIV